MKLTIAPTDKGINKNLPSWLIDNREFSDGNNMTFGQGYTKKVGGWEKFIPIPDTWQAAHTYTLGDVVIPTTPNGRIYKAGTSGTSQNSEPVWPTTRTSAIVTISLSSARGCP